MVVLCLPILFLFGLSSGSSLLWLPLEEGEDHPAITRSPVVGNLELVVLDLVLKVGLQLGEGLLALLTEVDVILTFIVGWHA